MANKKTATEKKESVEKFDVSIFCTRKKETSGVWLEPKVGDLSFGVKFLILGPNNPVSIKAKSVFASIVDTISGIKNTEERIEAYKEAISDYASKVCIDIKSVDGLGLAIGKKDFIVNNENIKSLLADSPELSENIVNFSEDYINFMNY